MTLLELVVVINNHKRSTNLTWSKLYYDMYVFTFTDIGMSYWLRKTLLRLGEIYESS